MFDYITGYPGNNPTYGTELYHQHTMSGTIEPISGANPGLREPYRLEYFIDTDSGQSGSPVYSSNYISYGIVRGEDVGYKGFATRITSQIYTCLERILEIPEINEGVYP